MTTNQIDAIVASNVRCTASYVAKVRLQPQLYSSKKADLIKSELARIEKMCEEVRREAFIRSASSYRSRVNLGQSTGLAAFAFMPHLIRARLAQ